MIQECSHRSGSCAVSKSNTHPRNSETLLSLDRHIETEPNTIGFRLQLITPQEH